MGHQKHEKVMASGRLFKPHDMRVHAMGWVVFVTMGGMDFVPCIPKNDEVCGRHSAERPLGT